MQKLTLPFWSNTSADLLHKIHGELAHLMAYKIVNKTVKTTPL